MNISEANTFNNENIAPAIHNSNKIHSNGHMKQYNGKNDVLSDSQTWERQYNSNASQNNASKKSEETTWTLNDFHLSQSLGKGKFGSVYLAQEKKSHFIVALKVLRKSQVEQNQVVHQVPVHTKITS